MALAAIGRLWRKTTKKDESYLSGPITVAGTKVQIMVYKNKKKEKPTDPDFVVYQATVDKRGN